MVTVAPVVPVHTVPVATAPTLATMVSLVLVDMETMGRILVLAQPEWCLSMIIAPVLIEAGDKRTKYWMCMTVALDKRRLAAPFAPVLAHPCFRPYRLLRNSHF